MTAPRFFATPADLAAWFAEHAGSETQLLVGRIDGIRRRIDDDSYSIRFTPRRTTSMCLDTAAERTFRSDRAAWAFFASQPPSYRRAAVWWVVSARRQDTRDRRLAQLVEDSAAGERVAPLRRRR